MIYIGLINFKIGKMLQLQDVRKRYRELNWMRDEDGGRGGLLCTVMEAARAYRIGCSLAGLLSYELLSLQQLKITLLLKGTWQ